jgi:hypothetical protein
MVVATRLVTTNTDEDVLSTKDLWVGFTEPNFVDVIDARSEEGIDEFDELERSSEDSDSSKDYDELLFSDCPDEWDEYEEELF